MLKGVRMSDLLLTEEVNLSNENEMKGRKNFPAFGKPKFKETLPLKENNFTKDISEDCPDL